MNLSDLSYAVWALCAAGVLGLWAASHRTSPMVARPAALLASMFTNSAFRVLLALAYMWLGWHLFAR